MKHSIFLCIHIYYLIIVNMEPTIIIQLVGFHHYKFCVNMIGGDYPNL